ncbi:glyoxalase-like protein [Sphingobacterium alimentarium]|uniref:Glyoxalase-like protein n=1 Tax=Sphingobacterium alimentarium TaxID=797292 RepID=A0A4R3VQV4_9SPHI|nr:VOC family protein [Sphingobacterium alimentarium]TCV09848.1 glyoxalase-like protein [Sphingobacterium alimentarium]
MNLLTVCPKLPMRIKAVTIDFYQNKLDFLILGDYGDYVLLKKDEIEIHFFSFAELIPQSNYGQVYIRVQDIANLYQTFLQRNIAIHPNGKLELKPWKQQQFSILDPDNNLLTFGESL